MFKFVIISLVIAYANAGGYGSTGGYTGGLALTNAYAAPVRALPTGPVNAAIQSTRTVEYIPVAIQRDYAGPQVIDVLPFEQAVKMIFRSATSPLLVQQIHQKGAPGQHESTRSEEEPSTLLHEVYKPVIQEFREVIQPFRKITQEVKPVLEEVRTLVAKGEGYRAQPLVNNYEAPLLAEKPY